MRTTDKIQLRYRAFVVKYRGPGAVRGSRVLIHDTRHGKRKALSYDDDKGLAHDQAADYLASIGIKVAALMLSDFVLPEVTLLTEDFSTQLV